LKDNKESTRPNRSTVDPPRCPEIVGDEQQKEDVGQPLSDYCAHTKRSRLKKPV